MPKGFFTQGVIVLLESHAALPELEAALAGYDIVRRIDQPASDVGSDDWMRAWPGVVVPFRPDVNGYPVVDVIDHPWPDAMGDPKQDPMLFGAWSMGHFGPITYPGNLDRAVKQAWHWREAVDIVPRHRAMIRVRSSYVLGDVGEDAVVMPSDYEPLTELRFVTAVSLAAAQLPQALCILVLPAFEWASFG